MEVRRDPEQCLVVAALDGKEKCSNERQVPPREDPLDQKKEQADVEQREAPGSPADRAADPSPPSEQSEERAAADRIEYLAGLWVKQERQVRVAEARALDPVVVVE